MFEEEEQEVYPWEKQDWETAAAFKAFTDYWLHQPAPRSPKVAYRDYRLAGGHPYDPNKQPSSSFRRWMRGVDRFDRKFPGSLTWKERAEAYDKWLQKRITEERIKRGARINLQWEDTVVSLFNKFRELVAAYDPKEEGADLMTLVSALEKLYKIIGPMFGFQQPVTLEVGAVGDTAAKRATGGNLTTADRLQTIAGIFQQAAERTGTPLTAEALLAAGTDKAGEAVENLKQLFDELPDDDEFTEEE